MRIDRERARRLSDSQVIDAYGRVFPESVGRLEGLAAAARAQRIAVWRERLWNVSWYMRCLNEWIARQANREDGCTGRFWEGRFRSQALLDAGAVLTCMCYVDLNPLRAGGSGDAGGRGLHLDSGAPAAGRGAGAGDTGGGVPPGGALGGELVPFADEAAAAERSGPGSHQPLPMRFADYVGLLQETVRAIRDEKGAELTTGHGEAGGGGGVERGGVRGDGAGVWAEVLHDGGGSAPDRYGAAVAQPASATHALAQTSPHGATFSTAQTHLLQLKTEPSPHWQQHARGGLPLRAGSGTTAASATKTAASIRPPQH